MLYFDNASTTKISAAALDEYVKASEVFCNPSALYAEAGRAKQLLEGARAEILKQLKAPTKSTFIFTGSATEANNAVINACVTRKDKKYLISAGEHSSLYAAAKQKKDEGYNVIFVPLKNNGGVDEDKLFSLLDDSVAFVSVIHVSNETGAINNIKGIFAKIKEHYSNILLHSDGVQAVGKLEVNLGAIDADFYTISAHKINGPKGVAGLNIKNLNRFKPQIFGGGQEFGLRSGTENLPGICAFNVALKNTKIHNFSAHKQALLAEISEPHFLVSDMGCVDNIISICFEGVRGETILHMLEEKGFLIGTGSACNSHAAGNRVLEQIVPKKYLDGAVRISFGAEITVENCTALGRALNDAVKTYKSKLKR